MKAWNHPIKAIIFDNDGTLLDTIPIYRNSTTVILGHEYTEEFHNRVNGMREYEVAELIVKEHNLNMTAQEFIDKRSNVLREGLKNSKPFPGAVELVKRLKAKGYKIGLATSSTREVTDVKFTNQKELFDLFDAVVCGDEVIQSKPDPEIFLKCLKKLGDYQPENTLVFEDAQNGVQSAKAAKMACSFFSNGDDPHFCDSFEVKPDYIFPAYKDFDESVFIWG